MRKTIQTCEKNQFLIHLVSTLSQGRMLQKSSLECVYFIECVAQFKPYRFSMDLYQGIEPMDIALN